MNDDPLSMQPSCQDDYDPNSLPVGDALRRIEGAVTRVSGVECVALRSALGRVLAESPISPIDVPCHTNSAMDGYAVRAADVSPGGGTLAVVGAAMAGAPYPGTVEPGTAVRIMTGAVLPAGADCVVMQEHVQRADEQVRIGGGHRVGQNIRQAGEDLARGTTVMAAGRRLQPADLGVLASLGLAEIRVRRRVRVAFFSTGDELRSIGDGLNEGEIYDSNRYTLFGMLTRLGADLIDLGVVRDLRADLTRAFQEAAACADAVITSGGVSVGEADYVKDTLTALGNVNFWKIAMKPGRPLAFGQIGRAAFFGLPGNPVSVMVTFYQFVRPALLRMMGATDTVAVRVRVPTLSCLTKRPGRTEFQRGILERRADGALTVRGTGEQGSGILSSVSRANCFIVLPHDAATVEAGAEVDVQPFEGIV